jgi:peptidoglycan/xylan/chitin deacetylase (PgdA/CDA1 family)
MTTLLDRWQVWMLDLRRAALYRRCLRGGAEAVILRYHSVGDPLLVAAYADPGLSLTPERFREQIRILKRRFQFVPMDEIPRRATGGTNAAPCVAITFDDGYRDNHDVALPILLEEGAVATFYVTSRPVEEGRYFWISELRRLVPRLPHGLISAPDIGAIQVPVAGADRTVLRRDLTQRLSALPERAREKVIDAFATACGVPRGEGLDGTFVRPEHLLAFRRAGMAIGGHTQTHPHLDRLELEYVASEIRDGKRDLETILGETLDHFAYPNPGGGGRNEASVRAALKDAGYRTAVTSNPGPLSRTVDPLGLPRLGVYAGDQERTLFRVLAS